MAGLDRSAALPDVDAAAAADAVEMDREGCICVCIIVVVVGVPMASPWSLAAGCWLLLRCACLPAAAAEQALPFNNESTQSLVEPLSAAICVDK